MNHYNPFRIKPLYISCIFCGLCLLNTTILPAQEQDYFLISISIITDGNDSQPVFHELSPPEQLSTINNQDLTPKGTTEEVIPNYYRHHKQLPKKFSGYAIELVKSEIPLKRNYHLFERFGNINVHQLENGTYSYCIIVDFKKLNKVEKFAKEVVLPSAPEAQVVFYNNGARKKM